MKISVIVAICDVEAYLGKCLDSIVNQTYGNLEIICVDDGSKDNSGKICDEFAERDPRVIVVHKPNGGVSSARNTGLDLCGGDYISFVDGDDWLEPDLYEVLASQAAGPEIDIAACGFFEDTDGESRPVKNKLPVPEDPMDMRDFLKYIYIRDVYKGVSGYLWSRIINAELIRENHLRFAELAVGEDQLYAAQCFMKARKTVYTNTPLYHYVQRQGSAMHDARRRLQGLGSCVAYQRIIELYEACGIDPDVVDYVKRFYVYHAAQLLKMALECGVDSQVDCLRDNVRRYFDVYCKTNRRNPERIEEVRRLLERTERSP